MGLVEWIPQQVIEPAMTRLDDLDGKEVAQLRDAMWQFDPLGLVAHRKEIEREYDALLSQILDAIETGASPQVIDQTITETVMIDWLGFDKREYESPHASAVLAAISSLQRDIRAIRAN